MKRSGLSRVCSPLPAVALVLAGLLGGLLAPADRAAADTGVKGAEKADAAGAQQERDRERDRVFGRGWRSSPDRAWVTAGDATGLHVLAAEARTGYEWRTVATLAEPGFDTDRWI